MHHYCVCLQTRLQANALEASAMMNGSPALSDLVVVAAREVGLTTLIGGEKRNVNHEELTSQATASCDITPANTPTAVGTMAESGGDADTVATFTSEARKPSANRVALEAAVRAAVGSAVGAAIRNSLGGAVGGGLGGSATTADSTSHPDTVVSADGSGADTYADATVKSNTTDGKGAHEKTDGGASACEGQAVVVDSDNQAASSGDGPPPNQTTEASSDAFVRAGVRVLLMLRAALLRAEAAAAGTPREGLADLIALSDMKVRCAPFEIGSVAIFHSDWIDVCCRAVYESCIVVYRINRNSYFQPVPASRLIY